MTKAPGDRHQSLVTTVPVRMPELTVALQIKDPRTLETGAIGVLAGLPGSDLNELGQQLAAIISVAVDRGAGLDEIRRALPAIATNASVFVQLAPAMLAAGIDIVAAARAQLGSEGLLREDDGVVFE